MELFIFYFSIAQSTNSGSSVQCNYPGSPAHASVAFTNDKMLSGTVATYTCDNGYELLGPSRRVCQANGTWTPMGIPFCGMLHFCYSTGFKSVLFKTFVKWISHKLVSRWLFSFATNLWSLTKIFCNLYLFLFVCQHKV